MSGYSRSFDLSSASSRTHYSVADHRCRKMAVHQQHRHQRAASSPFSYGIVVLLVVATVHLYQQYHYKNHHTHNLLFAQAMRLPEKLPLPSFPCRARFLSSTAAAFVASATVLVVGANDPAVCEASTLFDNSNSNTKSKSSSFNDNPRYIDKELQMKYGEGQDGNPRTRGILVRRFTGDSTPYEFPVRPIRLVQEWPKATDDESSPPFKREDFFRTDNNNDGWFYSVPKLVYHIDEPAVAALTQYYRNNIPPKSDILDICSSWVSHYPLEFPKTMNKICATGISAMELQFNDQLTGGFKATDLNSQGGDHPTLPYPDASFDVVTCVVSIDYMINPIAVLKEVNRVLRPGGKLIISQSNRCFPTKAIAIWLRTNDRQHLELINGFLQYAGGYKEPRQAFDITATLPDNSYRDPMFIVEAIKE